MAENSPIEWTDHTWSPWEGCTKVSPGCDHCYAEGMNRWLRKAENWGPGAPRREYSDAHWEKPLRWNKDAVTAGVRRKVFPSVCDPFDNEVAPEARARFFDLIGRTPNLDWLLLTKRIGNAHRMIDETMDRLDEARTRDLTDLARGPWPWSNVWLGATIVNQEEADRDIPKLLATPAAVRFLSMEPLLGPVNLWLPTRTWTNSRGGVTCNHCCNGDRCDDPTHHERGRPEWSVRCPYCRGTGNGRPVDWVIVGGESGRGARPMHPDWARSLRDQCEAADVPFLFKQHGEWAPGSGDFGQGAFKTAAVDRSGRVARGGYEPPEYPPGATSADGWSMVHLAGKKAAGRLLDGRTHDGFPEVAR